MNAVKPKRTHIGRWTLELVLKYAKEKHGDKFDYSKITHEHVKCAESKIPVTCNTCGHKWTPAINNHVRQGDGCASCSKCLQYTPDTFITRAKEINGNKYDYSSVKNLNKITTSTTISIKCNLCDNIWETSVDNHLYSKRQCTQCHGRETWTLDDLLLKFEEVHGTKFDYSEITQSDIDNKSLPITCNICNYYSEYTVYGHLREKECYNCYLKTLTKDEVIQKFINKYADKYDYSQITDQHVHNNMLTIICNLCSYKFTSSIKGHLTNELCYNCERESVWTVYRFIQEATLIHGDKYDYSLVKPEHLKFIRTDHIPIICKTCTNTFAPILPSHLYSASGCPRCRMSKGELECERILKELNIDFHPQFTFEEHPHKGYDFCFKYQEQDYLLEFDGEQHFIYANRFHREGRDLKKQQDTDCFYSHLALSKRYRLIRIDYKQINNIQYHLEQAFQSVYDVYFSNSEMYLHILKHLQCFN